MAADHNDGTVQYGSEVITVKDGSNNNYDTYVVDQITVNRPTKRIERTQQLGEPSGSVGVPGFVTGTLTGIQLSSGSTKEPRNGFTYTFTFDSQIGSETFFLTDVSRAETKDGEKKFNANFIKKYN